MLELTLFLSGFVRGASVGKNFFYVINYIFFFFLLLLYMCILGVICQFTTGCT